jgi:uncharacterized membrane protein
MSSRLVLFQILFISLCFSTIDSLDISSQVDGTGVADTTIIAKFSNSAEKQLFLNLSFPVENVIVKDRSGLVLDHKLVESGDSSLIYVTVPYDYLVFEMSSEFQTTKSGPEWEYLFSLSASENISSLSASLTLPKGALLKSTNGAVTAGDSLEIAWSSSGIDTAHKATMRASYELTRVEDDFTLSIVGGALALLIAIIATYLLTKKKPIERPKTNQLESHSLFKTLDENDGEIVREVYRSKGKCTQAHLYLHTHIAKATLSRRIASLENRGILKKSQKGNRNLVTITDIFKE